MDDSSQVIEYNTSCSLDISIFILSHQNSAIVYITIVVRNIMFSLTALVGNAVILLALRHCTSLHPSSKSLFNSLAISDFVIGLVGQPLFAIYALAIAWNDAELFCSVGLSYSLTAAFLALVSIWSWTVIALDRYLALILRFRYRAVVSGWLFIAFCTASIILGIQLRQIISNVFLLFCIVSSSCFYIKTYFTLRRYKLQMQGQSSSSMVYYRHSLNSMILVFCLFLITYLPFVCALAATTTLGFNSLSLLVLDITSFVGLLNSSLNPIVYCWRIRDIKTEAKRVIRSFFQCCLRKLHSDRVISFNMNSVA